MWADTEAELLQMAKRIKLKMEWYQPSPPHSISHFDIVPTKRLLAIHLGAIARELERKDFPRLREKGKMAGDRDMRVEMSDFELVGQFIDESDASHSPELWVSLITEEYHEFLKAFLSNDDVEAFDGAIDMVYVIQGWAHSKGLNMDRGMLEVHRTNMAKKWPDGTFHKREDGKIVKPPGWEGPRLKRIIDGEWPLLP